MLTDDEIDRMMRKRWGDTLTGTTLAAVIHGFARNVSDATLASSSAAREDAAYEAAAQRCQESADFLLRVKRVNAIDRHTAEVLQRHADSIRAMKSDTARSTTQGEQG